MYVALWPTGRVQYIFIRNSGSVKTTSKYAQYIFFIYFTHREIRTEINFLVWSYGPPIQSTTEVIAPYPLLGVEVVWPLWDVSGSASLGAVTLVEIAPKDNKKKKIIE